MSYVLALDQGTTSSRALVFDRQARVVGQAQQEFRQILPGPGIVEHDPEDIWRSQRDVARAALADASIRADDVAAIGIANQRETTILWERDTGRPVAPAIVWQSRVSAPLCERMRAEGHEPTIREKTGLVLDAYFSGSKIRWLLDRDPALRQRAELGEVLFGTVDSFLLWRMTQGRCHATDMSNASRTLLFNIHTLDWDDDLLRLFQVPRAMLPQVGPTSHVWGQTDNDFLGAAIPIAALAGDQQAATFGQACFAPGSVKNTYGTGAFLLLNTGERAVTSQHRLLTTVGWKLNGRVTYCLEGAVFVAGALVQWLRDELHLIERSADIDALAASVPDTDGVCIVPAFTGLGAPHWDPWARGAILGLTRGTTAGHLARAALDAIASQVDEVLAAMQLDSGVALTELKVDGGAAANNLLLQIQADRAGLAVRRPALHETTALGAATLAGLAVGYWQDQNELASLWALDREFQPRSTPEERAARRARWQDAVSRSRGWARPT